MKLLCVSDQIDPLIYSNTVKERYSDIDAIFSAGDLQMDYVDYIVTTLNKPTFFVFGNHNLSSFKYYDKKTQSEDYMASARNYDFSHLHGGDYVSDRVLTNRNLYFRKPDGTKTPLLITGVSGSLNYNNGQAQYTEREMKFKLMKLIPSLLLNKIRYGRYCDIFLTHASPRHIHDKEDPCHRGFECFNWFIKKFRPSLMLHGHIHLYDLQAKRTTVTEDTTVVNVFSHVIIDLQPDFTEPDRMKLNISVDLER